MRALHTPYKRRITAVQFIGDKPVSFYHVQGAYETEKFIVLPNEGKRIHDSAEFPTYRKFGKVRSDGSRTDYFTLEAWMKSEARAVLGRHAGAGKGQS